MKSLFSDIQIGYAEYQYWLELKKSDKLQYLIELYHMETYRNHINSINLNKLNEFFESLNDDDTESDESEPEPEISHFEAYEFDSDAVDRVDVMIDDANILIESNNLKALRAVSYKFVESGYILRRDTEMEKSFRKDKVTKYLRIFRIINQIPDLCSN